MVEVRSPADRPVRKSAAAPAPEVIADVWSRSGPKYRTRATVLLIVNVLLFAGLGCFAFWLRTGCYLAPAMDNYWGLWWQTFVPGSSSHSLTSLLTFPINLEQVPLQIVIHGLLLSALVSIPILVSILYRFYCSLPFILVVGFVALMPWLAITLLGSCLLASVKPFRFSFRYASALLGLVLVALYIIGVLAQSDPAAAVLTNPGHRIKLVAPWILALLASCVLLAVGLVLAKLVNYRPGVIAPLLATMFALPVALFETDVGRDELYYRLIEYRYGPRSTYFQERDVQEAFDRKVAAQREAEAAERSYAEIASLEDLRWQFELESTPNRRNLFVRYQEHAAAECNEFIKYFPDSRYAPAVLYIKGRALDMRIDLATLRDRKKLVFYETFPSPASRDTWMRLLANAPDSPFSAVALYRLAELDARAGRVDEAIRRLRKLGPYATAEAVSSTTQPHKGLRDMLQPERPERQMRAVLENAIFEGRRLCSILENNRDPLYGDEPLTGPPDAATFPRLGWLLFDPQSEHYRENLQALLDRYPGCQLRDNIEVELARTLSDPADRITALEACIRRYTDPQGVARPFRDALPEALYRLGEAYLISDHAAEAQGVFERLVRECPTSIWRMRAEHRLASLGPVAPAAS